MKTVMILLAYLGSVATVAGMATFLMYQDKNGWGWLIFILVLMLNVSIKTDN